MLKYADSMGKVGMDPSVFSAITAEVAKSFGDRVILSTPKGKPVKDMNPKSIEKMSFLEVRENRRHDAVTLEVYLILMFGTSIRWFTREFARRMYIEVREVTGFSVDEIAVNITGIRSKKTARRELRFVCRQR